jgi:serine/threonine-protein kinase
VIARQQGRWDDSRKLFEAVVAATATSKPYLSVQARFSAATIDVETGRFHTAVPLLEAIVRDFTTMLGEGDTSTIYARTWLATALFHSGEAARSEATIDAAHRAAMASSEREVQHIVQLVRSRLELRLDRTDAAEAHLRDSLAYFDTAGDSLRRYAERARSLLGECRLRQGRTAEAMGLLTQALASQRALFGEQHPELLHTVVLLALAHDQSAQSLQALDLYAQAQRMAEAVLAPGHPDRERIHSLASHAQWRQARDEPARRQAVEALEAWKAALQPRSLPAYISVLVDSWFAGDAANRFSSETVFALLSI